MQVSKLHKKVSSSQELQDGPVAPGDRYRERRAVLRGQRAGQRVHPAMAQGNIRLAC